MPTEADDPSVVPSVEPVESGPSDAEGLAPSTPEPPASTGPGRPWYPRPPWIILAAAVTALVVLVGTTFFVLSRRDPTRPFVMAVEELIKSPAMHYRTSVAGPTMDVRVTAAGDSLGTISLGGLTFDVMTLGGKTYLKAPQELLGGLSEGNSAAALAGRWITGGSPLASAARSAVGPELVEDVRAIVCTFSGRLDGLRRYVKELEGADLAVGDDR